MSALTNIYCLVTRSELSTYQKNGVSYKSSANQQVRIPPNEYCKAEECVRLIFDPIKHVKELKIDPKKICIVQVDEKIKKSNDLFYIKNFGYLKRILVSPNFISQIYVVSSLDNNKLEPFCSVKILKGNLFNSKMQTYVNAVNCVGVMGKGIALAFKKKYPDMFADYKKRCSKKELKLGTLHYYETSDGKGILNFPTKGHWREKSKLNSIKMGLDYLVKNKGLLGVSSIAFPALGCGNGGLQWSQVEPILKEYAQKLNMPVEIYAPY
ncbi:macro domain-containing protein [Candidatus Neptunochlamydia vexilliferae]|uniref:Macro domain-containing protein n=1 Tax=Candidatus Neptunichlamydia vexilliferae TaxID=1651774 RepID=A0ABS0AZY2_9BACT|nr:macro domain-containing protein [Candidatus Neptunochlamydia vexilliferae]MBF5059031.1 hypothetical protein [Candidatus Neptunochlamydia vexilliferae]